MAWPNDWTIDDLRDVIDSREIEARIDELEALEDDETPLEEDDDDGHHAREELEALREFRDDMATPDWPHGETLIRDDHFEDYARELAEDIGAIDRDATWPNTCIDWEQAANDLRVDYTSADLNGTTYWARA
jgi:hypothetical protein